MGKKASLFSGGNRSASSTINNAHLNPAIERVDISEEELLRRVEERKVLPKHLLNFTCTGTDARVERDIEFDFNQLTKDYAHHYNLINQILVGMSLIISPVSSGGRIRECYKSLPLFIQFLNDKRNLTSINVKCVADIDTFVLLAYKTYLMSNFPKHTKNRKFYQNIVRSCDALRKKFHDDPTIGKKAATPRAPQDRSVALEGYNRAQIKVLIRCCIKDIKSIKAFHAAYDGLHNDSPQLSMDPKTYTSCWKNDPDQRFIEILASIKYKYPDYPFFMSLDEVQSLFSNVKNNNTDDMAMRIRINKALERCSGKISFMGGKLGRGAIFAAMHFVPDTIFPFLLLSLISTGFNAECLKFFPDNIDEYVGEDMLDPKKYMIIWGYKGRTDKLIPVRSKKNQAFGAYNLLKYVESVITKYKDSEHYVIGSLFQFTRQSLATRNDSEGLICTFLGRSLRFATMASAFVKRHELEKLFGSNIDSRKIRSGYSTIALEGGMTPNEIAEQLGHHDAQKTPETVDKHYISDTASTAVKNKVIAEIQRNFLSDICHFELRVVSSITLQQLRNSINSAKNEAERNTKIHEAAREHNLDDMTIVHLLDLGSQTYILACEDMSNPTWPGHEKYVKNGQCRQFNKCCMCGQAVVFPEALPYIAMRIISLEKLQNTLTAPEWTMNFGDEYDAWNRILIFWNNKEQVANAWDAAKGNKVLLPKVMKGGAH